MSFKVYEVTPTELYTDSYKIKIDGKAYDPDTARVSAVPFNRMWPGHQRITDQTELAKMAKALNLDAIHDTVHEMARDEARHGKAFAGLLERYFK